MSAELGPDGFVEHDGPWLLRLHTVDWLALQLPVIAGFHALMWSALMFAPAEQVVTVGTLPVLTMIDGVSIEAHRMIWAVVFAVCAGFIGLMWRRRCIMLELVAWMVVIPVGFIWAGTFALAVIDGSGSAIGLTIWVSLLCWWGTVALGIGLRQPVPLDR